MQQLSRNCDNRLLRKVGGALESLEHNLLQIHAFNQFRYENEVVVAVLEILELEHIRVAKLVQNLGFFFDI